LRPRPDHAAASAMTTRKNGISIIVAQPYIKTTRPQPPDLHLRRVARGVRFGSRVDGALARAFLTLVQIGRVRSRVRPVDAAGMAAGPNALRGSGPNRKHAFEYALTQAGSPDSRNDRICITSSCPCQLVLPIYPLTVCYAAINKVGSLYLSPRTIMAQAIRAILLASATAATLAGRRSINRASHGRFLVPCFCA
jgi:hypothetical protein